MFHKPQLDKKETTIDSLIGKKIHVQGDVIFEGGLRVDGQITGNLKTKDQQTGTLIISEQARVIGEVHVTHLVMNGYIEGNVHISSLLELQPQARIKGDVHYVMLEMHQGAIVEGRLIHTPSLERPITQNQAKNSIDHSQIESAELIDTEPNTPPIGFNLQAAAHQKHDHQHTHIQRLETNNINTASDRIPQSLFTEIEEQTQQENDQSQNSQNVQNSQNAVTNPLEQLQNKIAEGFSFLKGKS